MRCQHANAVISEHYAIDKQFMFVNGVLVDTVSTDCELTGCITVTCQACNLSRRYQSHRAPKWTQPLLRQVDANKE